MVRHHVGHDANADGASPRTQCCKCRIATELLVDNVFGNGVGGTLSIKISSTHLHGARRGAAAPDADRPECADAALRKKLQLLFRDLIEATNRCAVALRELREPDEEMLRLNDDLAHPGGIAAVARWLRGAEGRLLPANHRNASDL